MSDLTAQQWNDRHPVGTVVDVRSPWHGNETLRRKTTEAARMSGYGVPVCGVEGFGPLALSLLTPIEPERPAEVRLEDLVLYVMTGVVHDGRSFDRLTGQAIIDTVAPLIERSADWAEVEKIADEMHPGDHPKQGGWCYRLRALSVKNGRRAKSCEEK